jgi:RNAse (barnase) inhibitor barstar
MARVILPTAGISDFDSFHAVCERTLGFPGFYGRNMNAWIDCMTCVDDPAAGMTSVTVAKGEQLTLEIPGSMALKERAPDVFDALVECTAAVNERFVQDGDQPIIALVLA